MSAILRHKDCGGNLVLNIAGMFTFKTPSLAISPDGIKVGVIEFQAKSRGNATLCCDKCDGEISTKDSKEILVRCSVCGLYRPVEEVSSSYQINCLCNSCGDMLSGKTQATETVKRIAHYLYVKPGDIKLEPFANILSKKIIK